MLVEIVNGKVKERETKVFFKFNSPLLLLFASEIFAVS